VTQCLVHADVYLCKDGFGSSELLINFIKEILRTSWRGFLQILDSGAPLQDEYMAALIFGHTMPERSEFPRESSPISQGEIPRANAAFIVKQTVEEFLCRHGYPPQTSYRAMSRMCAGLKRPV
jgi:hypothetical protein